MFTLRGITSYLLGKLKRQANPSPLSITNSPQWEEERTPRYREDTCFQTTEAGEYPLELDTLTLNDFFSNEKLGEGHFGEVFLACHSASQQQVALKRIHYRYFRDNPAELQVLLKIRYCPFTTHLYGEFLTETHQYLAMEYLSGGDLHGYIKKCGPLPLKKIRSMSAEILCGLQYLHNMGIVHRDIKPQNILLDKNGHIKIADFGVAVTDRYERMMIYGSAGTPAFMAPEILLKKPYNWAVDYFAFGITLYEMATGTHPFIENSDLKKAIITHEPYYSSKMNPDLKDLLERLLCKDQEKRRQLVRNLRSHPFFQSINWLELAGKARSPCAMTKMSRYHNNRPIMGTGCDRCAWAHPNHIVWNRFHTFRPLRFRQIPKGLLKQCEGG